jgi:hypothetical protein
MSSVKKKIYEKVKFRARLVNTNLNDDKLKLKYLEISLNYEQHYTTWKQEVEEHRQKSK